MSAKIINLNKQEYVNQIPEITHKQLDARIGELMGSDGLARINGYCESPQFMSDVAGIAKGNEDMGERITSYILYGMIIGIIAIGGD